MSQRNFNKIAKKNLLKTSVLWHDKFLPKRFTLAGQNIYHLKLRSARYRKRAIRENPNWRPLVADSKYNNGTELSNSVMQNWRPLATATQGKMNSRIAMVRGHATPAYVAAEIIQTNKNEVQELQGNFKKWCLDDFKNIPTRKVRM